MEGIGTFPIFKGFRGYGSDSGHTPFTSLLLFVLPLAFAFSRYTTERLTRPYSGGPTRLRGFPLDRQPLPGYLRVGRSLPELQGDVCVLCLPPAFAAVPQYLVHTPVELLPLIEPDKRISHTYGSSVSHQRASALRQGFRSTRIRDVGHPTWASAWTKLGHVYARRWLLRLSQWNKICSLRWT